MAEGLAHDATHSPAWGLRLTRNISVTWWYTAGAIVVFELMFVMSGIFALLNDPAEADANGGALERRILVVFIGGLVWLHMTTLLLARYRRRGDSTADTQWTRLIAPLAIAAGYGLIAGSATGSWVMVLAPLAQSLSLLDWPAGVRLKVVTALTALLAALAVLDAQSGPALGSVQETLQRWLLATAFAILLPTVTATSLWWWDVVGDLDRARAAEARLAATQERLRVAGDVHDLQGHHLQVIALQLELAERLAAADMEASLEQLRAARLSVTAAQQGTRDLAHQFQSVPLGDEIENAADLLRAAGARVDSAVTDDWDGAPARTLGPVIRETTTNVLRHGCGLWAKLALERSGDSWRYTISNDAGAASSASELSDSSDSSGSGLRSIARRVEEAGGSVEVDRGKQDFTVTVVLPGDAR